MDLSSARERLSTKLTDVRQIGDGILRGVRRSATGDMAVYVFDLSDNIRETAGRLDDYQDTVLGPSYFSPEAAPDLRWNHYLYFVKGKRSRADKELPAVVKRLEADQTYARKYVIDESEFNGAVDRIDSVATPSATEALGDISERWADKLTKANLHPVLDLDRPLADVVRALSSKPEKHTTRRTKFSGSSTSTRLAKETVQSVDVAGFRRAPKGGPFNDLRLVNLIFGRNGVGKTSFLEAIEFLYCGGNHRHSANKRLAVRARLSDGEPEVVTESTQPQSDFKTRLRDWYGSSDKSKANTLPNSFGRFNFLNTDAAVELSIGRSGSAVEDTALSLGALVSGARAAELWRRIGDVRTALEGALKDIQVDLVKTRARRDQCQTLLSSITVQPTQADVDTNALVEYLARIGWHSSIRSKEDVTKDLVEQLGELTGVFVAFDRVAWISAPLTLGSLKAASHVLAATLSNLSRAKASLQELDRSERRLRRSQNVTQSLLTELSALDESAVRRMYEVRASLAAINDDISEFAEGGAPDLQRNDLSFDPDLLVMPFRDVGRSIREQTSDVQQRLSTAKNQLNNRQQVGDQLDKLRGELQSIVRHIAELSKDHGTCPVCHSSFTPDQLQQRIAAIRSGATDRELAALSSEVELLKRREDSLTQDLWRAQRVERALTQRDIDTSGITLDQAVHHASKLIDRWEQLHAERSARLAELELFRASGLTAERVSSLCTQIGEAVSDDAEIGALLTRAKVRASSQLAEIELNLDRVSLERAVAQAMQDNALLHVADEGDEEAATALLQARESATGAALQAVAHAQRRMNISESTDLRALFELTNQAFLSATSIFRAVERERDDFTKSSELKTEISQLDARLATVLQQEAYAKQAHSVVQEICEEDSLERATADAVAATHAAADQIFERIHMPNEYRVTHDPSAPLLSKESRRPVTLNEVSTGQRAAYALSIFLAMNSQLSTGPRILLLDDPVAHVDDLNALSFLDYLRNLVTVSNRQLFFATADERIAGLFAHKFAFLGEQFKTLDLNTSAA